jgi:MFS family permease
LVYTLFFAAVTAVRFAGDALRGRFGPTLTIRLAGLVATAGYAMVLLAPITGLVRLGCAITGWVLIGAGMAVVWPVVTSAVGAAGDGTARRLSSVTTISYAGAMAGPAVIGYVASMASLPVALVIPAAMAVLVALSGPSILGAIGPGHGPGRRTVGTRSRVMPKWAR